MGTVNIMIVEDNTTVAADCHDCLINLGYKVISIGYPLKPRHPRHPVK